MSVAGVRVVEFGIYEMMKRISRMLPFGSLGPLNPEVP